MKCANEDGCSASLDDAVRVPMRVSCTSFEQAIACSACGRIHWPGGQPVFNRQNHRAFLVESEVVNRDVNGLEQSRFPVGR